MWTLRALVSGFLLASASGCAALLNPWAATEVQVKPLDDAAPPPAVPAAEVQLIVRTDQLPPGLFFASDPRNRRYKLYAHPKVPAPGAPHRVLAGMALTARGRPAPMAIPAVQEKAKAKAGSLGANLLFAPPNLSGVAWAVRVSQTPVEPVARDPEQAMTEATQRLSEYRPLGERHTVDLTQAAPVKLPLKRGHCYAVAVALEANARLEGAGSRALILQARSGDPLFLSTSMMGRESVAEVDGFKLEAPTHGGYVALAGLDGKLGCAWQAGEATLSLVGFGRSPALGQGTARLQVFSKTIPEKALVDRKAEMEARAARAKAEAEARAAREAVRRAKAEAAAARAEAARAQRQARAAPSRPSGPARYSFSLKNECTKTVKMFINNGGNPRFSGGTQTSMSANSIRSFSGLGSKTFWIIDDRGEGMSSFTASAGTRDMRITRSCSGFAPR